MSQYTTPVYYTFFPKSNSKHTSAQINHPVLTTQINNQ